MTVAPPLAPLAPLARGSGRMDCFGMAWRPSESAAVKSSALRSRRRTKNSMYLRPKTALTCFTCTSGRTVEYTNGTAQPPRCSPGARSQRYHVRVSNVKTRRLVGEEQQKETHNLRQHVQRRRHAHLGRRVLGGDVPPHAIEPSRYSLNSLRGAQPIPLRHTPRRWRVTLPPVLPQGLRRWKAHPTLCATRRGDSGRRNGLMGFKSRFVRAADCGGGRASVAAALAGSGSGGGQSALATAPDGR